MDPAAMSFPADQYSLGCILYYCLTGQYPFPGNNAVEKMMSHQSKQPRSVRELAPDCPDELIEVINHLMKKNPSDRYGSMSEVAAALRPIAMMAPMAEAAPARGASRRAQAAAAPPAPMARPAAAMIPPPPPIVVEESGYGDGYISPAAPPRPLPNAFPPERYPATARPTPQPVSAFEETVADASVAPAGYSALRENLHYDPRYPQHLQMMAPPPEYYQQRQGYGLLTIVLVAFICITTTIAGLIGLFIYAVKSGLLKQLLNQMQ